MIGRVGADLKIHMAAPRWSGNEFVRMRCTPVRNKWCVENRRIRVVKCRRRR